MSYNPYNNRNGYGGGYRNNNYGGGYRNNNYGGNYQGYQPQQDRFQNPGFPFDIGQVVRHKTTGQELTVISYGREQIECRLPDLTSQYFYVHELESIDGK